MSRLLVPAVAVLALAACVRSAADDRLRVRIDREEAVAEHASVALITADRVGYVPDPLEIGERRALEQAWERAIQTHGLEPVSAAEAEVLIVAYREEPEVTRAPGEIIGVDYRSTPTTGGDEAQTRGLRTYRYPWHDPDFPRDWARDVLIFDLIEADSGRLLRQVVDRYFFVDAQRHAGRDEHPPADFYEFPLETVLGPAPRP